MKTSQIHPVNQRQNLVAAWLGAVLALTYALHCSSPLGDFSPGFVLSLLLAVTAGLIAALAAHLRWTWLDRGLVAAALCAERFGYSSMTSHS